jgi:hypothetical protein
VVERVLKRNGIETYHNVSVSGEDDTAGHVRVFSDFGLMIASHSSQLKNLIFAPKYAGFLFLYARLGAGNGLACMHILLMPFVSGSGRFYWPCGLSSYPYLKNEPVSQ